MAEVLLVEDSELDSQMMDLVFKQIGLRNKIIHFLDAESAWDYLRDATREHWPRLIITDLRLPGMSGADLIATIRATRDMSSMTVVAYTGSRLARDEEAARLAGADHFFLKPDSLQELVMECKTLAQMLPGTSIDPQLVPDAPDDA